MWGYWPLKWDWCDCRPDFLLYFILRNLHLQLSNHIWPVSTVLHSTALKGCNGELLGCLHRPGIFPSTSLFRWLCTARFIQSFLLTGHGWLTLGEHCAKISRAESLPRSWANDRESSLKWIPELLVAMFSPWGWEKQRRLGYRERWREWTWRKQWDERESQNPCSYFSLWFQFIPKAGPKVALRFCDTLRNSLLYKLLLLSLKKLY